MSFRFLSYSALAALAVSWTRPALADSRDVWVLPAHVEAAPADAPVNLEPVARRLDAVLREAVQDFGFTPRVGEPQLLERDEAGLTALAREAWVVSPELGLVGGELALRLVVVPQASNVLLVRVQNLDAADVEVRTLGMLRELLAPSLTRSPCDSSTVPPTPTLPADEREPVRSEGRAVLALHAAALGGYLGFALQRASGSDDARLTYPLAALGAGVGVGSAVIVADEWDIDGARAWYLGGSMFWPSVSMLLLVESDGPDSPGRRYLLGLVGAVGGLTLATAALAIGDVTEGGAALTHSGAALGLLLGGLGEMAVKGDAELTPRRGMGAGALIGVLVGGAAATQFKGPSASEMLSVDLSALLGGLAGAALGTPVLVSQDASPTRDRIWLSGIMAGTLAGAALSYWVTQSDPDADAALVHLEGEPRTGHGLSLRPQLGWMGMPFGLGVSGAW